MDPNKQEGAPAPKDNKEIIEEVNKVVLSEVDKRLAELSEIIKKDNAAQQELQQERHQQLVDGLKPQAPQPPPNNAPDDYYENPQGYIDNSINKALEASDNRNAERDRKNTEMQLEISQLIIEYPELNDRNSDFRKAADKISDGLAKEVKGTAGGIKIAVLQAAAEAGILPKSKRGNNDADDFQLKGKGRKRNVGSENNDGELDSKYKDVLKKMRVNMSDPDTVKRLKERHAKYNEER